MNALSVIERRPLEGEVLGPEDGTGRPFFIQRSPFTSARLVRMEMPEGATLDFYVSEAKRELPPAYSPYLEVYIGEHRIERRYWARMKPKRGQAVTVRVRPGGGGGGGKNILRAVIMIAIVVGLTVLAPGIGTSIGLTAGTALMTAFTTAFVAVGTFAAMMALNALIPPPNPLSGSGEHKPFLTGGQNAWAPYGWIPRVFGKRRVYPVLAAHPYTEISGKKHYLRLLLNVGFGPIRVSDIRIGNTPLSDFVGVQYEVYEGGPGGWGGNTPLTLYTQHVSETPLSIALNTLGATSTQTTAVGVNEISVDIAFPQGLIEYTKKGAKVQRTVNFLVEYRAFGSSGSWTQAGWISDADNDAQQGSGILRGRETSSDLVLISGRWSVSAGQYDVRVTRQTAAGTQTSGGTNQIDFAQWTVLRTNINTPPVVQAGVCLIAIRIKASDQLNGMIQNVNCLAEAYLPVYSGGVWTYQITRSPAWAYCDILRRRGPDTLIADTRIDLATIQAWDAACAAAPANDPTAATWTFDGVLEGGSVFDAARRVAAAGRASFTMKDGKYSVTRDMVQATPVQHFTPRNSWNYSGTKVYIDLPHALKVQFANELKDYADDETYVYADGYTSANATRFDTLSMPDCTSAKLAWREGRYHLAVGSARPEEHYLNTDIENLRCGMGDRVQLSHDVILVGLAWGRILSNNSNGTVVTQLNLDQEVTFVAGKTYQLRCRHSDGTSSIRTVTPPGGVNGTYTQVIIASEPVATAPASDCLFMYGETGLESAPMVVKKIEPADDLTAKLTLVAYDPNILTADTGTIPAFSSLITNTFPPEQQKPSAPLVAVRSDDSVIDVGQDGTVTYRLGIDITPPGSSVVKIEYWEVQYREGGSTSWKNAGADGKVPFEVTTVYAGPTRPGASYDVQARSLAADGRTSNWTQVLAHTAVGKTIAPDQPSSPTVTAGYKENYVRWTNGQDADLQYVEVLASLTNSVGTAVVVGRTLTGIFTHGVLTAGQQWFYWLRSVDYSLNASTPLSAGSATVLNLALYDGVGADGNLSAVEKQPIIREFSDLGNEKTGLDSQASALGVSATAYDTAYTTLASYLSGLTTPTAWNNTTGDTTIVRSTWNTNWSALYTARQALLNAIDTAASTKANWTGVNNNDPTNNPIPASGATVNPPGESLQTNDSFETFFGTSGFPGWTISGTITQVTSTSARRGVKSARMTGISSLTSSFQIPVAAGETLYLNAGFRTTANNGAAAGVWNFYCLTQTGASTLITSVSSNVAAGDRTLSNIAITVGGGFTTLRLYATFEEASPSSTAVGELDWLTISRTQDGSTSNPVYYQTTDPFGGGNPGRGALWFDSDSPTFDFYVGDVGAGVMRRMATVGAVGGSSGTLYNSSSVNVTDPQFLNSANSMTPGGTFTNGAGGNYSLTSPALDAAIGISRMNPADNLIRNPDLLVNTDFWTLFANGAGVTVPVRTAGTATGDPAFYWTGSTTVGTCVAYPNSSLADAAPAEAGKYYRFEGLLNGSITVYMQFYDAAGNELSATGNSFAFTTSGWTAITCGRVAPPNTARVYQQFWFVSSAAKLGQYRLFAVRTDTGTSPLTPAVNRNADIKEVATDGRPAFWFVSNAGTPLPTYLGWKDPTTKTIMTTTTSAVPIIGSAFKLESGTQYEVEVLWGADGGSNSGSQVVMSEYDSDLPADTVTLKPTSFVEVPAVAQTRTQVLYSGSLADASGGSFTSQIFTYTPTSTAKWAALYLYEGFGATRRLLIKRAYVRNKATWGATSGTNIKRSSGAIASGDTVIFNDNIDIVAGKPTNIASGGTGKTIDNSLTGMTAAGVYNNGISSSPQVDAKLIANPVSETGADKTQNQQVTVSPYTQAFVEVLTDSTGAIISGQLPWALAQPKVQKGSTDVTTSDALTTYAIANTTSGLGTVTVDNTAASSTKGQPTIPNTMSGSGSFQLVISYNSVEIARITITAVLKAQAPATTPPSGATGDSIAVDAAGISGTTAPGVVAHTIRSLGPITLATGQNLHGAFTGSYTCGSHSKTSTAIMRWQYSTNNTTWTDFISGTSVTASIVATSDASFNQYPGSISCNQAPSSAPAPGTYYARLVCYKSGTGTVSFDGTDTAYLTAS